MKIFEPNLVGQTLTSQASTQLNSTVQSLHETSRRCSDNIINDCKMITISSVFTARCYALRGLCRRKMSVRPSVCPLHAGILSKRLHIASNFLHRGVATSF